MQTASTHCGTFRVTRISFGVKTAPSLFNQFMQQILHDFPGVEYYFDDIIVHGATIDECHTRLLASLQRLREYNLHLNTEKVNFLQINLAIWDMLLMEEKSVRALTKLKLSLFSDDRIMFRYYADFSD